MSKNVGVAGYGEAFLACIIGEIAKSRCVSYFSTVPNVYLTAAKSFASLPLESILLENLGAQ